MSEPLTLYKLIILYMLEKVDFPLTNAQISGFVLDKGYTTYFHLQQAISELIDSELIESKTIRNSSYFEITAQGKQTLSYFEDQISDGIKSDISAFFKENIIQMREELSAIADYYKSEIEGYHVRCRLKKNDFFRCNCQYNSRFSIQTNSVILHTHHSFHTDTKTCKGR